MSRSNLASSAFRDLKKILMPQKVEGAHKQTEYSLAMTLPNNSVLVGKGRGQGKIKLTTGFRWAVKDLASAAARKGLIPSRHHLKESFPGLWRLLEGIECPCGKMRCRFRPRDVEAQWKDALSVALSSSSSSSSSAASNGLTEAFRDFPPQCDLVKAQGERKAEEVGGWKGGEGECRPVTLQEFSTLTALCTESLRVSDTALGHLARNVPIVDSLRGEEGSSLPGRIKRRRRRRGQDEQGSGAERKLATRPSTPTGRKGRDSGRLTYFRLQSVAVARERQASITRAAGTFDAFEAAQATVHHWSGSGGLFEMEIGVDARAAQVKGGGIGRGGKAQKVASFALAAGDFAIVRLEDTESARLAEKLEELHGRGFDYSLVSACSSSDFPTVADSSILRVDEEMKREREGEEERGSGVAAQAGRVPSWDRPEVLQRAQTLFCLQCGDGLVKSTEELLDTERAPVECPSCGACDSPKKRNREGGAGTEKEIPELSASSVVLAAQQREDEEAEEEEEDEEEEWEENFEDSPIDTGGTTEGGYSAFPLPPVSSSSPLGAGAALYTNAGNAMRLKQPCAERFSDRYRFFDPRKVWVGRLNASPIWSEDESRSTLSLTLQSIHEDSSRSERKMLGHEDSSEKGILEGGGGDQKESSSSSPAPDGLPVGASVWTLPVPMVKPVFHREREALVRFCSAGPSPCSPEISRIILRRFGCHQGGTGASSFSKKDEEDEPVEEEKSAAVQQRESLIGRGRRLHRPPGGRIPRGERERKAGWRSNGSQEEGKGRNAEEDWKEKCVRGLTADQRKTVLAIHNSDSPILLLQGAPGTGKSHSIAALVDLWQNDPEDDSPIFVCTGTHASLSALRNHLKKRGIDVASARKRVKKSDDKDEEEAGEGEGESSDSEGDERNERWSDGESTGQEGQSKKAEVFLQTVYDTASVPLPQLINGSRVLLDEAPKLTEPASLIPIVRHQCKRLVLSGDVRQLAPIVLSDDLQFLAQENRESSRCESSIETGESDHVPLTKSLFERLEKEPLVPPTFWLSEQFRMSEELFDFVNRKFYGGRVRSARRCADQPPLPSLFPAARASEQSPDRPPLRFPFLFIDTSVPFPFPSNEIAEAGTQAEGTAGEVPPCVGMGTGTGAEGESRGPSGSVQNGTEALIIRWVIEALGRDGVAPEEMMVLSPYELHRRVLRETVHGETGDGDVPKTKTKWGEIGQSRDLINREPHPQILTVDSVQGCERDFVIFSAVRANTRGQLGFTKDPRRLCVALTRARRGLILVGNGATLRSSEGNWKDLVHFAREKGAVACLRPKKGAERYTTATVPPFPSQSNPGLTTDEGHCDIETSSIELVFLPPSRECSPKK
uniref:AAA+ ATPase domain-containing protein n=1 Tax=Chromera velia CCMP2878 TaxID=1169474 RepID=A0A0G4GW46_9ALVE|eukprot:Cvel_23615.t1-p1 / transcript=Cvel_23615.t1 / gene=Cvel_23615 / organism=Chromera_velia_CCMP2878 / gene_product=Regulator of nonsense transcripts 1 homolog, putative / transcript_product=Regulator of nonsense transcripts 1 homolog, putative / location=Cvel_scaffold2453:3497-12596(-) / protein_length=1352 / sequence_SO=supercontig / SO=protein_coding / is_pseudo=false